MAADFWFYFAVVVISVGFLIRIWIGGKDHYSYWVLSAKSEYGLNKQVEEKLNDGYKLAGGVCAGPDGKFYQAVYVNNKY